jgi:hypothetical protein
LIEAKLTISKIKTQVLELAGKLIADDLTDKAYAMQRIGERDLIAIRPQKKDFTRCQR